jgi:cation diffusion facilitator CzcD-associated flavoprotein CzcO
MSTVQRSKGSLPNIWPLQGDIEAYCYMPFLSDTGYMPKQKYASSVEIRTYIEDLVKHFGLQSRIMFRSQITSLHWEESSKAWKTHITTRRGPKAKEENTLSVHADFVTLASGVFPYPQVPRVPGLPDFQGQMFHTSRWNYDVTGGTCDVVFPELDKLEGARVGIIGTGATAIQIVPQLAKYAKELYVFQRTPSHVHPRGQRDTDPVEWSNKIAAENGWQKHRMENLAECLSGHEPGEGDLVNDNWSGLKAYCALVGSSRFGRIPPEKAQDHIGQMVALDAEQNKTARERILRVVKEKQTAEKLTPWYPTWCKRPTFSDQYLETFNNEHIHLIDTDGKGIDRVTHQGVVANGQEYPVDVLVLSTGYRSPASRKDPGSKTGIEIVGRDSRTISEKYEQEGICTLHGVCTNGFPNLFYQSAAQAGASANYMHVIDVLSEHIASIIAQGLKRSSSESAVIEASYAAETAWGMQIAQTAAYFSALVICTPGYNNAEGEAFDMPPVDDQVAMMKKAKAAIWQAGIVDFTRLLETWRGNGKLEGLEVSTGA